MGLETYKCMQRWYEKAHQALERIDYINKVQKGQDTEEHGIRVLMDNNIAQIRKEVEYWVSMVQEPQQKMQKRWEECEKSWDKINQQMRNMTFQNLVHSKDFSIYAT
jgi:hypothetical protein